VGSASENARSTRQVLLDRFPDGLLLQRLAVTCDPCHGVPPPDLQLVLDLFGDTTPVVVSDARFTADPIPELEHLCFFQRRTAIGTTEN